MDNILLLNKSKDISSAGALNQLKKKFQIPSMGHAGTLDPFATGLLIVATGRATKLLSYFQDLSKEYTAQIQLGIQTDTDDRTGEVIERSSQIVALEKTLPDALQQFRGWIDQVPPIYSALKIQGQRAYKLAREKIPLELASRRVQIHDLKILEISEATQSFQISVTCSKGTYIRSLARDLGKVLGSVGTLYELERTAIGPYRVSEAQSVEDMKKEDFQDIQVIFEHYPAISLRSEYFKKVWNGAPILPEYLLLKGGDEGYSPSYYRLYEESGNFLGIVENHSSHFFYRVL